MSENQSFWSGLGRGQQVSLLLGTLLIVAATAALGWWATRPPSGVLFSGLAEQDLAAVTSELDKLKQPYELSEDGRTVLVDEALVHKTRMTLMSHPLPLSGAVGFELFNNAEFGASDFVQKVNYQRALQGELTRTIQALEPVQRVRVHLGLPEQGLFKRETSKAKASVALVLKPGASLLPAQVLGIQRLVGASVPEIKPDDVTVVNQDGVVLSRPGAEEAGVATSSLDAKQSMEAALRSKLMQLLDQMFKPGDAMVSVDVSFNHQHSKVTTEELLTPPAAQKDQLPSGVVVRERSVTRERAGAGADAANTGGSTTSQELDYQTGRRVSQVSQGPGEVSRITVGVVLRTPVSEMESQRLTSLVSAAVGLQTGRGDQVAIYAMNTPDSLARVSPPQADAADRLNLSISPELDVARPRSERSTHWLWLALAGVLFALMSGLVFWKRRRPVAAATVHSKSLSDAEREQLLGQMKQWLAPEAKGQEP